MANDDASNEAGPKKTVVVVGAGLVGALTAVFLGRRGYKVGAAASLLVHTAGDAESEDECTLALVTSARMNTHTWTHKNAQYSFTHSRSLAHVHKYAHAQRTQHADPYNQITHTCITSTFTTGLHV